MEYLEIVTEALSTLTVNKLRTSLATLGIVIGIGSVIALISLGQATQQSIESQIRSLGSNLLTVQPSGQNQGGIQGAAGGGTTLTLDDAKAIQSSPNITTISKVSPEYSSRTQVTTGQTNTNTQVIGVMPIYSDIRKVTMENGTFISDQQVNNISKVAVLGPTVVSDLFGENVNPIGQTIRISGQTFTIIGITKSKGGTGFQNQDDIIYIPISTAQKQLFGSSHITSIAVEAKSADVMIEAQNQVGYLLLARHKLSDPTQKDFSIFNQQDLLNTINQTTSTFTTLLAGVAAISLLVGGIGIMNIMLVTVTERTREIGLRKALGAKKRLIITQFLIESIILTFVGGIIGIGVGILASFIITSLTGAPLVISLNSIFLAFIVSTAIGILFGWYPARRAANLQPIEALRYE